MNKKQQTTDLRKQVKMMLEVHKNYMGCCAFIDLMNYNHEAKC